MLILHQPLFIETFNLSFSLLILILVVKNNKLKQQNIRYYRTWTRDYTIDLQRHPNLSSYLYIILNSWWIFIKEIPILSTGWITFMQEYIIISIIMHNVIYCDICEDYMSYNQIILILHHHFPFIYFIWVSGTTFKS